MARLNWGGFISATNTREGPRYESLRTCKGGTTREKGKKKKRRMRGQKEKRGYRCYQLFEAVGKKEKKRGAIPAMGKTRNLSEEGKD